MKKCGTIHVVLVCLMLAAGTSSVSAQGSNEWEFQLAPLYLWAVDLSGTMTVAGREAEFAVDFADAAKALEATFTVHFEGWKGRWGVLADFSWLDLGGEQTLPEPAEATVGIDFQMFLVELAAGFEFDDHTSIIFGARYTSLDPAIDLPMGSIDESQTWTDAIVGLMWRPPLSNRWTFTSRFDLGTGSSELVWNAAISFDYRLSRHVALFLGYRHLDTDYEDEDTGFAYDAYQTGPLGALRFFW